FGHQSRFVLGRCGAGVGDSITGFSLSLPLSDTSHPPFRPFLRCLPLANSSRRTKSRSRDRQRNTVRARSVRYSPRPSILDSPAGPDYREPSIPAKPANGGSMERPLNQKLLAEFVGTFTLIFLGAGAVIHTQNSNLVAIAFASGLAI